MRRSELKKSVKIALCMIALPISTSALAQRLAHYYDFNGESVVDKVGDVNGALYNGAIVTSGSLNLDGTDDYVELNGKIIPTDGSAFSVFIKYNAGQQSHSLTEMISQGFSGGTGFYIGQVNGILRLSDNYPWGETNTLFPLGAHQLLLTSGADGTRVIIDGSVVFTSLAPLNLSDNGSGTNTRIGRQFQSHGEWFSGTIDQLKVFDHVVSYVHAAAACPTGLNETTQYGYDALGRLSSVSTQSSSGAFRSAEYKYDRSGNRVRVIDHSIC
jgi:hypothetical protein